MSDDSKQIGQWLKGLREHAGLSQQRLAINMGVGRRQVISWEKGDSVPGGRHLLTLLAACGVRLVAADPPPPLDRKPETREQLLSALESLTAQTMALREAASRLAAPDDQPT
jgi:transcriptional regulator with XRE-family HTH domain